MFHHLRDVDILKMDIEGGEWAILADRRLAETPPKVLMLEYHSRLCPDSDPKRAAAARLTELGYVVEEGTSLSPEAGTLLAWRPPGRGANDEKNLETASVG